MTSQEILAAGSAHDELWLKEIALQLAIHNEYCAARDARNAELDAEDAAEARTKQDSMNQFLMRGMAMMELVGASFGPPLGPGTMMAPPSQPSHRPRKIKRGSK